jgi:translation initiation factor IF-3
LRARLVEATCPCFSTRGFDSHRLHLKLIIPKIENYFVNKNIERGLRWAKKSPDQIRVIDEGGEQLGVLTLAEGLKKAQEKGLDLVLITAKADLPVCRITEAGKFLYQKKKEQKKSESVESKKIKIRFNTSSHDMETRLHQAEKFLKKGDRVQAIMMLRGRENALKQQAVEKMEIFLKMIQDICPVKIENRSSPKSKMLQYEITPNQNEKQS